MGAERTQKGAVGQQLAASGRARRAEAIRRKGDGEGGPNIGRDISRGVMEDQMEMNDKRGKQKQGKPGRPGRPIDGRPPVMKPIEEGGRPFPPKEGRPVEPPMDGRPPSKPIRGDDQYGPGRPFPGRPKEPPWMDGGPRPKDPPWMDGSPRPKEPPWMDGGPRPKDPPPGWGGPRPKDPLVEEHPWGREDDPNYGIKKDAWHQKRKEMEMKRKEDMWRRAKERRGGTDLGPGRGDRLPDQAFAQDKFDALRQQGGQNLERPGAAATTLQDFLAQMANLRSGGIR